MKNGWTKKSVGEILQLEYGKPLDESDRKPNGRFPVYGANGEKDRTDKFYHDKPSIIVGRKGSAGEINLTEKKFWPLDVTYFVTFDDQQHDLRFLYYLLTTLELTKFAKGVKPGINRNEVYSQVTKVPRLPEQQRIVGILDEAFARLATAKDNAEKNLQNAHALFESHLQSVFTQRSKGWVERSVSGCFKIRSGDSLPAKAMAQVGTVDVYGGNGITGKHDQGNVTGENIIIGRVGAKCGNVRHVQGDLWVTDNAFFISEFFLPFDLSFLARLLTQSDLRATAHQMAQPVISYTSIRDVVLQFPASRVEQARIACGLDALEAKTLRLASLYERKLTALEALKKSLLHQAFTGQL